MDTLKFKAGDANFVVDDAYWKSLMQLKDPSTTTEEPPKPAPPRHTDLSWLSTGQKPPVILPTLLTRSDGHSLLYDGRVNILFGDPESGKTWLAKAAVVEALDAGGSAAMIDVDHNGADSLAGDLVAMGVDPLVLADPDRFRLFEPDDGVELTGVVSDVCEWCPRVAVLDSLGEVMPMLGKKSNDNDEVTDAMRRTAVKMAKAGACVIAIDHLPKSKDNGEAFSIGAMAKKRACDGVMLLVKIDPSAPLAPGRRGRVFVYPAKDRLGQVRKQCEGGKNAGTFVLDSTGGRIRTFIDPAKPVVPAADGGVRKTGLMARVSEFLSAQPGPVSKRTVEKSVTGNATDLRRALDVLVMEKFADHDSSGYVHVRLFVESSGSGGLPAF